MPGRCDCRLLHLRPYGGIRKSVPVWLLCAGDPRRRLDNLLCQFGIRLAPAFRIARHQGVQEGCLLKVRSARYPELPPKLDRNEVHVLFCSAHHIGITSTLFIVLEFPVGLVLRAILPISLESSIAVPSNGSEGSSPFLSRNKDDQPASRRSGFGNCKPRSDGRQIAVVALPGPSLKLKPLVGVATLLYVVMPALDLFACIGLAPAYFCEGDSVETSKSPSSVATVPRSEHSESYRRHPRPGPVSQNCRSSPCRRQKSRSACMWASP